MMNSSYQLASVLKEADQYRLIESRPRIGISANRKDGQTCLADLYPSRYPGRRRAGCHPGNNRFVCAECRSTRTGWNPDEWRL